MWRLFRYLVAHSGKHIPSDTLIDILWSDEDIANPRKSLQNLVYRLRKVLPETDVHGEPYILSKHRTYAWNEKSEIYVDAFEFLELVESIKSGIAGAELEKTAYRILELYTGDYMEDISSESWVENLSVQYRNQYFDCMNTFVSLLYEQGKYPEIIEVCTSVLKINMFEEHFHAMMINAMLAQGSRYSALTHYRSITTLLQKELEIEPSEELRAAGRSINAVNQPMRPDISMVIDDLRAASAAAGPMFCEMDVFRQIFQLYERMNRRDEFPSMLVMYTIVAQNRTLSDQEMFRVMAALKRACMISLRRSDVVTQHSNTQLLMMLPSANEVSISIVLMRIQQKFTQLCLEDGVSITTQVRSLIIPKVE
ncbi:winged helix-turn-helix domain-containing protein [Christensenellaceae bacterium OttesenSCG-928-M15]|nr:winged helix-turn-helix domain-containing protein [Christensenellaceae bacterium OttesenSCG-928-M15]